MDVKMDYFPFWLRYVQEWMDFGMTHEQVGKLVLAAGAYLQEDVLPDFTEDFLCRVVWTYLRKDLDNARASYASKVEAGKTSAAKRKKKVSPEEQKATQGEQTSTEGQQNSTDLQQNSTEGQQNSTDTQQKSTEGQQKSTITKTKTESKTKTKSISISKSKTKAESTTAAKTEAPSQATAETAPGDENAVRRYGEHGWISLTDGEFTALSEQMGKEMLSKYIFGLDRYVQSNQNAAKYKDWKEVLLKFYREKWFHTTAPTPLVMFSG